MPEPEGETPTPLPPPSNPLPSTVKVTLAESARDADDNSTIEE